MRRLRLTVLVLVLALTGGAVATFAKSNGGKADDVAATRAYLLAWHKSTLGGCPPPSVPSASTPLGPPSPASSLSPAPEQIVACVGAQSITGATFSHWAVVAQKSERFPKHRLSTSEVIKQVMGFLISSYWVLGEAADLKIHVSESVVRHTFDHIRAQQFPKRKEFKAFLRQSGQTVADLLLRVRLNLTSARIQQHVAAGHRGARGQQRALSRFVHDFTVKWMVQTYCDPGYAVTDCGHVQVSL